MIVFKTFWKVVNKYKGTIIGYTVLLLIFGTLSMSSNDVTEDFKSSKPDVIIVDPPRKGLDDTTIENLNKLKLNRLVYVSCNPATLMRDLQKLMEVYEIKSITPTDCFCYTSHVECVAVLELKQDM